MLVHYKAEYLVEGGPVFDGPVWEGWTPGGHEDNAPVTVAYDYGQESWCVVDGLGHILAEGTPAELLQYMTEYLTGLQAFEERHAFPPATQPKSKLPAGKYGR